MINLSSKPSRRWLAALVLLPVAPFLLLAVFHLARSGRDHTIPFLAMLFLVLCGGVWLLDRGGRAGRVDQLLSGGLSLFTALGCGVYGVVGIIGVGFFTQAVLVEVRDATTGQPIQGARVRLSHGGDDESRGETDARGMVELEHHLIDSSSLLSPVADTSSPVPLPATVEVEAEGYQPWRKRFRRNELPPRRSDPAPAILRVELRREDGNEAVDAPPTDE